MAKTRPIGLLWLLLVVTLLSGLSAVAVPEKAFAEPCVNDTCAAPL